jgi:hypothetical protein
MNELPGVVRTLLNARSAGALVQGWQGRSCGHESAQAYQREEHCHSRNGLQFYATDWSLLDGGIGDLNCGPSLIMLPPTSSSPRRYLWHGCSAARLSCSCGECQDRVSGLLGRDPRPYFPRRRSKRSATSLR